MYRSYFLFKCSLANFKNKNLNIRNTLTKSNILIKQNASRQYKKPIDRLLPNLALALSTLIIALLLSLLPILQNSTAKAFDLPIAENKIANWDLAYGKAWNSFSGIRSTTNYTAAVQTIWKLYGCYQGTVDGQSGRRTREAEALWLKFHEKKNGPGRPAEIFGSKKNYLKHLQVNTATVCDTPEVLNKTKKTHAKLCRLDDIGRNYLKKLAEKPENKSRAMAQQLAEPLKYVIENFDTLFPDNPHNKAPQIKARDDAAQKRLETYGVEGVNPTSTKKALIEAARTFHSLTLQYGHNPNKKSTPSNFCDICFKINSWKYLENLAQSRGGRMFNSEDPTYNVKVDDIELGMINEVTDNILVHRRMTAVLAPYS